MTPPAEPRLAPGLTPLIEAPRLAAELGVGTLCLKLDTANPTHSFKDRVVAVARAKALEHGLTTLACSSTGNLANAVAARAAAEGIEAAVFCPGDLEPEKLIATAVYGATIYAVDGTYDDCSRLSVELSFELDWAFVNVGLRSYYAEGSKTLAFEVAEQLGWQLPDASSPRSRPAPLFSKVTRGSGSCASSASSQGRHRGCRRAGRRLRAGRRGLRRESEGDAAPARHRRTLARDRQPRRRRPRGGDRQGVGRRDPAVPEDEVGENMALLAETTGVFGETAAGVTLGALRRAVASGAVGDATPSSCSSPGTG